MHMQARGASMGRFRRVDDIRMNTSARNNGAPDARSIHAESCQLQVILEFAGPGERSLLSELPALLSSAPHRLMFLAGAMAVLLSMLWWACVLASWHLGTPFPAAPVPAGWAHAMFTQYGMLPLFMFGFLLTVFPRWLGRPPLTRRHYVPVFVGVFGGYLLAHAGLLDRRPLLIAGLAAMLAGWLAALFALAGVLLRSEARDWHARSCVLALCLGALGLIAFTAFVFGADAAFAVLAIKLGTFGLLLPIYFTVCHRMVPFFIASVVGRGYRVVRPPATLLLMWIGMFAHLALELSGRSEWLWLADAPLAILFLAHWLAWQPWRCMRPGLLAVLHLSSAWLPIAFILYALQGLLAFLGHGYLLGRAPAHALTIGFFGSMLVAMVTRVTQGHSGRPLEFGAIPWLSFVLLQVVAVIRIQAEFMADAPRWLLIAALAWLVAFLPWVLRSLWIFATPRVDGKPG
jgi:uncharacterized protein involved in response to NO